MNEMSFAGKIRATSGRVIGLARRAESRAPMEELRMTALTPEVGVLGDCKGRKFPDRHVTILSREDWADAMLELAGPAGPPDLPWTTRRANVFVEGIRLPRGIGSMIKLGDCMVQVTDQTTPCVVMENAYPGLMRALSHEWRGGVTCKVLAGGGVTLGDVISIIHETEERKKALLPG